VRVLFVNPGRAVGGAEESLLLLLEGLRAHGVEPAVAVFGGGPFQDRLSLLGVPTISVELPLRVRSAGRYRLPRTSLSLLASLAAGFPTAIRLAVLARRTRADVIHTNGMKGHLLGGLAGRLVRVPGVCHLRDFLPAGPTGRLFRQALQRLPQLVLAVSEAVAESVRPVDGVTPRVVTLYDPLDIRRFHPGLPKARLREELGISPAIPLVGLVAHLTPWKGHELFLDIARAVVDTGRSAHFVVAGGPIYETSGHAGYADNLQRRASALGLANHVAFLGVRADVPEILAALDVLVHCPTAPEPLGRVLVEAMAMGRPIVAARSGGIPEAVEDRVTGVLVEAGDRTGFVSAVLRLLGDPTLRERLGCSGRRHVEARFGVTAHVTGVLDAYQTVTSMAA
jgi:glycosyltransferase involved in cell wall biosynthesis